jgi:hypothetical protein
MSTVLSILILALDFDWFWLMTDLSLLFDFMLVFLLVLPFLEDF